MMDHRTKRQLGATDVQLSALGLGTAGLGDLFERISEKDAQDVMEAAWNAGCRYFDTSPFYGHGQSEIRAGRGLYSRPRGEFALSTKVGRLFRRPAVPTNFCPDGWVGALPFSLEFDYTYSGIMRSVEDSYLRLGMAQIDMLLIHDLDPWFHPDQDKLAAHRTELLTSGWKALEELKNAGIVKAVGAGLNDRQTMTWFLDNVDVDFFLLALRYTLLDNDILDLELPRCEAANIGIVIGGAFNSGILATGPVSNAKFNYEPAPPDILAKVRRIQEVCNRHHTSMVAAALQFPAFHPAVASVIPGALRQEHVVANTTAFDAKIPSDLWAELKAEGLLRQDAPCFPQNPT
jgi:D-threo-aldose 1-dehydrogenase